MTGYKHRSDTELIAQGTANIASVFFGGIPATGAIARTATNVKSGAKTPVAGVIHALTLLLVVLLLSPLAKLIPLASLSAVLVMVAWNMSEKDHFIALLRAPRGDVLVLITVFLLTVLIDLTVAVEVGMVMAAFLFMKRMSEVSNAICSSAIVLDQDPSDTKEPHDPDAISSKVIPHGAEVYEINGPFFFGVADKLGSTLSQIGRAPRVFILRMRNVPVIDATGLHALEEFYKKCRHKGITLLLSGIQGQTEQAIKKSGLESTIGQQNILPHIDPALKRAQEILKS
jgi:SulP family sulfate permease